MSEAEPRSAFEQLMAAKETVPYQEASRFLDWLTSRRDVSLCTLRQIEDDVTEHQPVAGQSFNANAIGRLLAEYCGVNWDEAIAQWTETVLTGMANEQDEQIT